MRHIYMTSSTKMRGRYQPLAQLLDMDVNLWDENNHSDYTCAICIYSHINVCGTICFKAHFC